jgi:hypothetical protein
MGLSMHQASIPVFVRSFSNLSALLDKAAAHAEANRLDPATLVSARLAPDMLTLAGQVQRASDTSKAAIARLSGLENPRFPDTESTLAELQDRIARTVAFLTSVKVAQVDGSEERTIALKLPGIETALRGDTYLLDFVLPNFFFHITTAYDILRHCGVQIGKRDYLGRFD